MDIIGGMAAAVFLAVIFYAPIVIAALICIAVDKLFGRHK